MVGIDNQGDTNMKLKLITALALATLVAAPASAGPLQDAFVRQQQRIANGVVNNQLSAGEFARLQKQQARILKEAQFLKNTGNGLSNGEKAYLRLRQIGASGNIFIKKHN
jgi:F0F1-type ATP synthase membrane subunit b/b'